MSNRQQTTHRITRGYDGLVTCYVRDDQGPSDLASKTLAVSLRPYGTDCVRANVDAAQESTGKVTFTIPSDVTTKQLTGSLYRFDIEADGAPIYEAMLEVV